MYVLDMFNVRLVRSSGSNSAPYTNSSSERERERESRWQSGRARELGRAARAVIAELLITISNCKPHDADDDEEEEEEEYE